MVTVPKNTYFKKGSRNRFVATKSLPLNQRTIAASVWGARQYVQDEKIQISRRTITKFQYQGRWADEYSSFVTSETKRNLYKDPDKFFRVMHSKPEWYAKKFIYRQPDRSVGKYIKAATLAANKLIYDQLRVYIAAPNVSGTPNISTGAYLTNMLISLNGAPIRSVAQLDSLDSDSVVDITNWSEYAGRAESVSFHYAKVGGIFYYAARMVRKKYPMLNFRFTFVRTATGARPRLVIGTKQTVNAKLQKPRDGTYDSTTGRRTSSYRAKYAGDSTAANPKPLR